MNDAQTIEYENIRYRFEKSFRKRDAPQIEEFLCGEGPDRLHLLLDLVHSELELRLRAGQTAELTEYLRRFPELDRFPNELVAILETEILFHKQSETMPSLSVYEERYPQLSQKVRQVFVRVGAVPPEVPGYELFTILGQGGMGVVYKARQLLLKRDVALKLIRQDKRAHTVAESKFRFRFRAEAEALASVNHPNVVQVFDHGEHEGDLFIAMELVNGLSLRTRLSNEGVLAPRKAAELLEQIALALQAVHDQQIVHRDLKPDNILLNDKGEPKIIDFGLARPLESEEGQTKSGVFLGTAEYSAPEQAGMSGAKPTPAIDVYGLGAILYACLTGRPPVIRGLIQETLERVRVGTVLPIRETRPEVPQDLETICLKCLRKEPKNRYASAAEIASDLHRFLDGKPIVARPVGHIERSVKWVKRNPMITGSAIAVMFMLMLSTSYSYWMYCDAKHSAAIATQSALDADVARKNAEIQKNIAEQSALEATAAHKQAARTAYNALISQADVLRDRGNVVHAIAILDSTNWEMRGWEYGHLRRQLEGNSLVLKGHGGFVNAVAISPDGKTIASGSVDKTARLWDHVTGIEKHILKGHTDQITAIDWNHDGTHILTGSTDNSVRIWDATTGKEFDYFKVDTEVWSAAFSPDGTRIAVGSRGGKACVLDIKSKNVLARFEKHREWIYSIAWHPDGKTIVTSSHDGTARIWNAATGMEAPVQLVDLPAMGQLQKAHKAHKVHMASWNRAGDRIVSCLDNNTAIIWDARTGKELKTLKGHTRAVMFGQFSPDGRWLATGSRDNTLRIWNAATGLELSTLKGHSGDVVQARWNHDGSRLVSGSEDGTLRVWDVAAQRSGSVPTHVKFLRGHNFGIYTADWCRKNDWIVAAGTGDTARIWNAFDSDKPMILLGHKGNIWSARWNRDGSRVATASADQTARVWDATTGQSQAIGEHVKPVLIASFSPDGKFLVTGSDDKTAKVWDLANPGIPVTVFKDHSRSVWSAEFSPDGSRIITGSEDATAMIWDAKSGKTITPLLGHTGTIRTAIWSRCASRILTASEDASARIWNAETGKQLFKFLGSGKLFSATWSPDETRVATCSADGTTCIWDAATGFELVTLRHDKAEEVWAVAFNQAGDRLLTGSRDRRACIWNGRFANEVAAHPLPSKATFSFSSDSRRLLFVDEKGLETSVELPPVLFPEFVPPKVQKGEGQVSPDGRFEARLRGNVVKVMARSRLTLGYDPWLDADSHLRN